MTNKEKLERFECLLLAKICPVKLKWWHFKFWAVFLAKLANDNSRVCVIFFCEISSSKIHDKIGTNLLLIVDNDEILKNFRIYFYIFDEYLMSYYYCIMMKL